MSSSIDHTGCRDRASLELQAVVEPSVARPTEPTTDGKFRQDYTVLWPSELFWRDHQPWLAERGYMLRPRYHPDWVASYKDTPDYPWDSEDGVVPLHSFLLDATRISDGEVVILKKVFRQRNPYEIDMNRYFSSEPLKSHPRNHCIQIYDVLAVPDDEDIFIMVMPLLRPCDDPRFETIGEVMEFLRQVFEGMQFLHQCRVAHRDCMDLNIMMDPKPMFPDLYHPMSDTMSREFTDEAKKPYTRTARPPKYYIIDFGLSLRFSPDDTNPLADPVEGGDRTVPEFQNSDEPRNPFPTDIYYLGNLIRETFLEKTTGLEFLKPLVDDMVQDDMTKRPTIDEVVERLSKVLRSLHWWNLRKRLVENIEAEDAMKRFRRRWRHFFRTVGYTLTFKSPLPVPHY
ncbi:unnamed protein product [Somion occarium]|uniref:Protein kinase domain-containing protein n=1 Tax=Somion occarium TaxID=3059160 RepID=A0ABP1DEM3_9APHY